MVVSPRKKKNITWEEFTALSLGMMIDYNLVGDFNHLEKYYQPNGKDDIPYIYDGK